MTTKLNKGMWVGKFREMKGALKEQLGKITGNREIELDGAAEKTRGRIQQGASKNFPNIRKVGEKATPLGF